MKRSLTGAVTILIAGLVMHSAAEAQQKVYKSVDKDGNVTYSDQAPDDAEAVEALEIAVPPPATQPPPTAPTPVAPPPTAKTTPTSKPKQPPAPQPVAASSMSLEELDRRCEEARQRTIAPLRKAEIEKCQQDKRNDPGYCERFYKDYGEGGRTLHGTQRPRMFDDLPECVEALNERNVRSRGTREKQR